MKGEETQMKKGRRPFEFFIFKLPWLQPEPVDMSILNRLPIAYTEQIWPSLM